MRQKGKMEEGKRCCGLGWSLVMVGVCVETRLGPGVRSDVQ